MKRILRHLKFNLPLWISLLCLAIVLRGPVSEVFASTIGKVGAAFYQTVQDEGGDLAQEAKLNFTGAGVSCVDNAGVSTDCTITGMVGSAYDQVQDEGVNLTQRTTVDFTGAGVTCADTGAKTQCTIAGGSGGISSIAKMTRDAAQTVGAGYTKVAFDNIEIEQGTGIDADDTTNDRFDILEDGIYLITTFALIEDLGNANSLDIDIYVNGSVVTEPQIRAVNSLEDPGYSVSDVFELSNGDYIEMYIQSTAAKSTSTNTEWKPRMSVIQLLSL